MADDVFRYAQMFLVLSLLPSRSSELSELSSSLLQVLPLPFAAQEALDLREIFWKARPLSLVGGCETVGWACDDLRGQDDDPVSESEAFSEECKQVFVFEACEDGFGALLQVSALQKESELFLDSPCLEMRFGGWYLVVRPFL